MRNAEKCFNERADCSDQAKMAAAHPLAFSWHTKHAISRNCAERVRTMDVSPIRSPQSVHTFLLPWLQGKEVVEVGTRNGDGMECFAQVASKATAVEMDRQYCDVLKKRSRRIRWGFKTLCGKLQQFPEVDADVFTWWLGGSLDKECLMYLREQQRQGKIRHGAALLLLFDLGMPSSARAALSFGSVLNATRFEVPFDEADDCRTRLHNSRLSPLYDGVGSTGLSPRLCQRAKGTFIVLHSLLSRWEGLPSPPPPPVDGGGTQRNMLGCAPSCGVGKACAAVPGFKVLDTYDTRAPMVVADQLVKLARGRSYVEIGSRRGDILACVSHYAKTSIVYEAQSSYCSDLRTRFSTPGSNHPSVRCPAFFSADMITDADVYYTWISPPKAWDMLHMLRAGIRRGTVRRTAKLATIVFPLSHYLRIGDNPVYMWRGVHLASLASRVTLLPFYERALINARGDTFEMAMINETVAFLEFDLAESKWDGTHNLIQNTDCKGFYHPSRCPTPHELQGELLVTA